MSPQGRAAVAAGRVGEVVKLVRQGYGWYQNELAERAGYSQSTISRVERGESRATRDTAVLTDLAGALGIPAAVVGVAGGGHVDGAATVDDVQRRAFLSDTVGVAVAALLPHGVATASAVTPVDVGHCWSALRRLFELDAQQGAGMVYGMAVEMATRLQETLHRASLTPTTRTGLSEVTAAAVEHAGWLAYDAGHQDTARRWWLETCHLCQLADITDARVTALASMSLQAAADHGNGAEAVTLAQAARAAAGDSATPTLLSVLAAREAVGHATNNDSRAATAALSEARGQLERGTNEDDPFWVDFWGPADLACHETRVALATGNLRLAERSARHAVTSAERDTFPRNHTGYSVRLAHVLTRLGQLDEAIAITSTALGHTDLVRSSRRIHTDVGDTISLLARQRYRPAREFAHTARSLLPTAS